MSIFQNNNIGKNVAELDIAPNLGAYSGVEIIVDEDTTYFAGIEGGRILTIENPWGTQEQADNILTSLRGFTYQPFTASDAILDPAAEIGDAVTVNAVYSGIFKMTRNFGSLMAADIAAPQDEEIDHEYPYEPKQNREINRRFSAVESEFRIQSNEIAAKVSKTSPEGQTSFSWNLTDESWEVKSNGNTIFKVTSAGAEVTGTITATDGKIGGFKIDPNAITYNGQAWGGTSVTGIYLGTQGLQIGRKPRNSSDNTSYFSASANGSIEARNIKLTGKLYFSDGTSIETASVKSTVNSVSSNGSKWTTGSGYGYNYNDATDKGSGKYPGYFKATAIVATTTSFTNCYTTNLYLNGSQVRVKWVTIGGESFYVLRV